MKRIDSAAQPLRRGIRNGSIIRTGQALKRFVSKVSCTEVTVWPINVLLKTSRT